MEARFHQIIKKLTGLIQGGAIFNFWLEWKWGSES